MCGARVQRGLKGKGPGQGLKSIHDRFRCSKKLRKNRGRPDQNSSRVLAAKILQQAPPSWKVSQPLAPSRFLPPASSLSLEDLQCSICECVVDQPLETPCRKLVRSKCIVPHIRSSELPTVSCPCCDQTHDGSSFSPAPDVVTKVLGSLLVQCEKPSCTQVVELRNLRVHINTGCQSETALYSPSKLTVAQLLSRPLTSPPTTKEQKAATSVVKRMITSSSTARPLEPGLSSHTRLLKLPTDGQVRG